MLLSLGCSLVLALAAVPVGDPPHDPDRRLAEVERRLAATPDDAQLWLMRAELELRLGRAADALRDADWARGLVDGAAPKATAVKAEALLALGRPREALVWIERSLGMREHWLSRLVAAKVLLALEQPADAAQQLECVLATAPSVGPDVVVECVRAWRAAGDGRAAARVLKSGIRRLGPLPSLLAEGRSESAVIHADDWAVDRGLERSPVRASGPRLLAAPHRASEVQLVGSGASWRFLDDGSDQGAAWRAPGFDDSAWGRGPSQLGYGDGDEATVVSFGGDPGNKHVTTYFRTTFQVSDPAAFTVARVRLLRDDGAVIYLNGNEIARSNMPPGPIDYLTPAASGIAGVAESEFQFLAFDPRQLVPNTNVLAVEIHQWNRTSSDISFDLELLAGDAFPAVVRGPYIQSVTPGSAILRWRTDCPTDTQVWLGASPNQLVSVHSDPAAKTEHVVQLTSMPPDTKFYYGIGDARGVLAGGDSEHYLTTAPPIGTAKPTRVWVIGDSGTADVASRAVRDGFLRYAGQRRPDVWLMLGDNAYIVGSDAEYQKAVFETYPTILRNTPLWPTLGNHDAYSADSATQSGVYYDIFSLPKNAEAGGVASGTEAYYSFDHGGVHFICLDSDDTDRSPNGAMMNWLAADLAANAADWTVAFFHHPPYTKGSHDSDSRADSGGRMWDMRQNALPILEAGGVDLVLSGHSHSYERSFLIDGHYGTSNTLSASMILDAGDGAPDGDRAYPKPSRGAAPNEGAVYIVGGCSGLISGGPLNHPVMHASFAMWGSVVLDVDGDRLDANFVDFRGQVLDSFSMVKGRGHTLSRTQPSISMATGGVQDLSLDAGSARAGDTYFLLGSFGSTPGFSLGGLHVPLNVDLWFDISVSLANSAVFQNSVGILDSNGRGQARLAFQPSSNPNLVGLKFEHAYLTLRSGVWTSASNAVRLRFVQ